MSEDWNEEIDVDTWIGLTRTCVYAWVRDNKFLYIGSSARGIIRLENHLVVGRVEDFEPNDRLLFTWVDSLHDARQLEKKLIVKYKPKWNGSFTGRGYVTSRNVERLLRPK